MSVFLSIKDSLIKLLKGIYPNFAVFAEEISKTRGDDEPDIEDYFFIDMTAPSCTTIDGCHSSYDVFIDIICCTKDGLNRTYFGIGDRLDKMLRPVFCFENRAITVTDGSWQVVDGLLHYTFHLNFVDSIEENLETPYIEELSSAMNGRT